MFASQTLDRMVYLILLKSWVYLSSLYELSPVFIGQLPPGGPCPEGEVPLPLTNQRERCGHVTSCGPITAHLVGAHHVVTPPGQQPLQGVEGGEGAGPRQPSTLCRYRYHCSGHKMLVQRCVLLFLILRYLPAPINTNSTSSWHSFICDGTRLCIVLTHFPTYISTLLRIKVSSVSRTPDSR